MRLDAVIREVRRWVSRFDYVENLRVGAYADGGRFVEFVARTTKTRASSIVTRVGLIVADVAKDRKFTVLKRLDGDSPATRDDLATWHIVVQFKSTRRVEGRAA